METINPEAARPIRYDELSGTRLTIGRHTKRIRPERFAYDGEAEIELMRDLCLKDFWTFFCYGFGALINPKGERWVDPRIHEPMARWAQKHIDPWLAARAEGHGYQLHLAILVHREIGKTTLMNRALQLWLHLRDPEIATATGAETIALSRKMLAAMKAVLDGSDPHALWPKLFGNWAGNARTWTGSEVVHGARRNTSRQDPSFTIFGVETSIVGTHPDAYFYDDPISYEAIKSDANWLATVNSQISSLIPVVQSDGLVVWVGTRYDEDDHFGVAFRDEGVKSAEGMETDSFKVDPEHGQWHAYFMAGRDRDGVPTTPKVWNEDRLKAYQKKDPLRYASQIMNDPSISEFNPLTREQISQCVVKATDVPWGALRYAITTDTAFYDGGKQTSKDETVLLVHGYPRNGSGDVYIVEGHGSNTWRAEDFGKILVSLVQRYRRQGRKVFAITDEVTMAGKKDAWKLALTNFFNDVNEPMPQFYQFSRGGKKKVERIATASSFWVDGHVRVVHGAPGVDRLMDQMAKIGQMMVNPRTHDDWADAHADAFEPELYSPMRRTGPQKAPYERGATAIAMDGVDPDDWGNDESRDWEMMCPRPPLR